MRNLIRTLSGGERQAVAISRSIYWNTKFIIMDEPTAALGVAERITKETTTDEIVGLIVGSLPGDYRDENDEAKEIAEVGKETSSVDEGQEEKQ